MKKLFFILILIFAPFFSVSAQSEKLDALFTKYQETDGITSIKISRPMFGMLSSLNIQDSELDQIKPLLKKINGLKILIVEKPESTKNFSSEEKKQLNLFQNLSAEISNSVKNLNLQELMTVKSSGNKIKFLSSDATNGFLNNLLLSINSGSNNILMMLDGKITMDDLNNLMDESQKINTEKSDVVTENISSEGSTQVRSVGEFTGIEVSNAIKVNFTQDNKQSVMVDVDEDKQQYVITKVENGILKVYVKTGGLRNSRFKKLVVNISAPHLQKISTSSAASFFALNEISEERISIETTSGSSVNGEFKANEISVEGTSGSNQKLTIVTNKFNFTGTSAMSAVIDGETDEAIFETSSASTCNAQNFVAKNVVAKSSSASTLKVHAIKSLSAETSSAASIRYNGKPQNLESTNSSGGSTKPID